MTNIGYWDGLGLGTGIAPSRPTQSPPRVHLLPAPGVALAVADHGVPGYKVVVGLISVGQLT